MKTLVEISKQADKLYDEFLNNQKKIIHQLNGGVTEEEQQEILEWLHEHDYRDTDEYDIPDNEGYGPTDHWDEQAQQNYLYAKDEDGNWLHPLDKEIN